LLLLSLILYNFETEAVGLPDSETDRTDASIHQFVLSKSYDHVIVICRIKLRLCVFDLHY